MYRVSLRATAVGGCVLLSLLWSIGALAADLTRQLSFDIPSEPLAEALIAFARQSDVVIVASSDVTADKRSSPVRLTATPVRALTQMLQGTGLVFTQVSDGSIVVRQVGKAA